MFGYGMFQSCFTVFMSQVAGRMPQSHATCALRQIVKLIAHVLKHA
jgi:hypothetical protein